MGCQPKAQVLFVFMLPVYLIAQGNLKNIIGNLHSLITAQGINYCFGEEAAASAEPCRILFLDLSLKTRVEIPVADILKILYLPLAYASVFLRVPIQFPSYHYLRLLGVFTARL